MGDLTRLGFVKSSAKAAVGVTAIGALAASEAEANDRHVGSEPVVAFVKNPKTGEVSVMSGDREVVVRDRKLAAMISRAAR